MPMLRLASRSILRSVLRSIHGPCSKQTPAFSSIRLAALPMSPLLRSTSPSVTTWNVRVLTTSSDRTPDAAAEDGEGTLDTGTDPATSSLTSNRSPAVAAALPSLMTSGWAAPTADPADRDVLSKTFHFRTYTKCLDFFALVAIRAKVTGHHPTCTVRFHSVTVQWTTHNPPSLSELDVRLAAATDEAASLVGTVKADEIRTC